MDFDNNMLYSIGIFVVIAILAFAAFKFFGSKPENDSNITAPPEYHNDDKGTTNNIECDGEKCYIP